ncbi:MAG: hemerythrin family protein [Azonexaceae bacterium]|jgi:hemerythrin|nr:hemerythrin family protein [Azonexaceae bacterium]
MSLITWTPEQFATNVVTHDNEHKHLFNLLNELHRNVGKNERSAIGASLDGLIAYVVEHFSSEEKNMAAAGYAALDQHKLEHAKLVQTCADLQAKFHAGAAEISEQTTAFLRDWLIEHIPKVDFKYAPTLSANGIH